MTFFCQMKLLKLGVGINVAYLKKLVIDADMYKIKIKRLLNLLNISVANINIKSRIHSNYEKNYTVTGFTYKLKFIL